MASWVALRYGIRLRWDALIFLVDTTSGKYYYA
jgi:hypothetical protein